MKYLILILILIANNSWANSSSHRIAAVVNDDIISNMEIEDRTDFVIATTGLSPTSDIKVRLAPQILQSLINEKLQMQAANRLNIKISDDEINNAINSLAENSGKNANDMLDYLKARNISINSFKNQVAAQLAWSKIMARKISPKIDITDSEIKEKFLTSRQLIAREYKLSSIILPVDSVQMEDSVRKLANKLVAEIRNGVGFSEIASQLSNSGTSLHNIWISSAELDPIINDAISSLKIGDISNPVRSNIGYQIIKLHEKRTPKGDVDVALKQIILPIENGSSEVEISAMMNIARDVAKHPGSCTQSGIAGIKDLTDMNINISYIRTNFKSMSSEILPLVQDLSIEQVSEPFAAPDGIHLLMMCEKIIKNDSVMDKEKIKEQLFAEKFRLGAMKYMRDLRRSAFIEKL